MARGLGFSGVFELYQPIVISEAGWWHETIGYAIKLPAKAGVSRGHWYVSDVEELVIGARVALVRRDLDALMDFAGGPL